MKLESIRIRNFRAFKDVVVPFDRYTCFVGPNGTGKSTVIAALKVFFHESTGDQPAGTLGIEDFHLRNTDEPIEITLTFTDLSPAAADDLAHYVRGGKLIVMVRAAWDEAAEQARVEQIGWRLVEPEFKPFFAAEKKGAKVGELREIYVGLRDSEPELPAASTKAAMTSALREFEEARPERCEEAESADQFYGSTRGANRLASHIQWVHVPAVKDAAEESTEGRETWLTQLLRRAVRSRVDFEAILAGIRGDTRRRYEEMLDDQAGVLDELSASLTTRIQEWTHPDAQLGLSWMEDPSKAIRVPEPVAQVRAGDPAFEGSLTRQGHGFQRAYLLALLQELARDDDGGGPTLLLGVEEPELYQHPPQAMHMAHVLEGLAEEDAQLIVCTHSPYFVSGVGFPGVRLCRKSPEDGSCHIAHAGHEDVKARLAAVLPKPPKTPSAMRVKLEQSLQPVERELFFAPRIILVEGIEDAAYIAAQAELTDRVEDLRRKGCLVLPASGKSRLPNLIAVCQCLDIDVFVVFDADGHEVKKERRAHHARDNRAILDLLGWRDVATFPDVIVWKPNCIVWPQRLDRALGADVGEEVVREAETAVRRREDLAEGKFKKNPIFVGHVVRHLHDNGSSCAVLKRLLDSVLGCEGAAGAKH